MRIVLVTYGSRGDVQPLLAFSLALREAGHHVMLVCPPERVAWVRGYGCRARGLGRDVTAYVDGMERAHSLGAALRFIAFVRRELVRQFDLLPDLVAGADLVVGSSLAFGLATVAERQGIPYRYIAFTPQLLPSRSHPFMAYKSQGLPGWWNGLTWRTVRAADRLNLTRMINERRRVWGLSPIEDAWAHILGARVIVASDSVLYPVPRDAPAGVVQIGYLHLEQPDVRLPGLEAFLSKGTAPVYAGFGSMPRRDQARNLSLLVRAVRAAGRRVIVGKFWEGPSAFDREEDVFFLKGYPHLRLFPRMAAVIHHGGAGTTASCTTSGVPQVIVPHILDQYGWGYRVWRSGLGPRPVRRSRMTWKRLARALNACLGSDKMRRAAEQAARKIDRRESLARAVLEAEGA